MSLTQACTGEYPAEVGSAGTRACDIIELWKQSMECTSENDFLRHRFRYVDKLKRTCNFSFIVLYRTIDSWSYISLNLSEKRGHCLGVVRKKQINQH